MDQNIPTQQPPVTPQTPPVQQPPTMESVPEKKPIFSIIAGVIVIVAIAGYIALASFYNLWPFSYTEPEMEATPTPRAEEVMKTYNNSTYGYSVSYPPKWTVAEYSPKRVVIGVGNDAVAIRLMSEQEFNSEYGKAEPEEITLANGVTAYRFTTIEETAEIIATYVEHENGYLLATYLADRSQANKIVQSLEIK